MSNGVLLPLNVVIFERIFLLSSSVFIVDFENLNDGGNVNSMILTIAIQVTINISKNLTRTRLVFTVDFQSIPKFSGISKKKLSLKFCSNQQADAGLQIYRKRSL